MVEGRDEETEGFGSGRSERSRGKGGRLARLEPIGHFLSTVIEVISALVGVIIYVLYITVSCLHVLIVAVLRLATDFLDDLIFKLIFGQKETLLARLSKVLKRDLDRVFDQVFSGWK